VPSGALPFVLIAAVAAIALWVVVRFPALAPRTAAGVTGWLATAVGLTLAAKPTFALLGSVAGPVPALVVVELASGVCMMLSVAWTTLWVIRASAASH
jgi:hypothetical protein